jgi:hypothetical protein
MHTAALLNDGTVLVLGGGSSSAGVLASAELYNPGSGPFALTGSLNTGRVQDTATLMNNGMVLVAGGRDANSNVLASTELYNPLTLTFTLTGNLNNARGNHAATLLNNGMVLVEGGFSSAADMQASAELYDPVAGTFSQTGSLNVARRVQTATLLTNGLTLVAGGFSDSVSALSSAEKYQPATLAPANLVSIALSPRNPAIPAGTSQNLGANGTFSDNSTQTLASVTWSTSNAAVATVSSDSSNRGVTFGVATGSTTVSACTGSICGSTTITVVSADPEIASLSPSSGPVGFSLTIVGSGFGAIQGASTVLLNQSAATVTSWSPTSIVVAVPNDTTGNIVVEVGGVGSNLVEFTVLPTPLIASVSPTSGDTGSPVQISGLNFGDTQGSSTVTVNGTAITVTSWSATSITGLVATGATTGNVIVTVAGVPSNPLNFTVINVPSIFSLSPALGPAGTFVTIIGADFGPTQGTSTVSFNGTVASVTSWGSTGLTAIVPTGSTTGSVVVNVAGTLSNGVVFITPGAPNVFSVSPATAPTGWLVTITGTNFGGTQGTSTVSFNGNLATATSWSPTQIVATVPSAATSGIVTVTASGVAGTAAFFNVYTGPVVSSFSPNTSAVGNIVSIQGSGFFAAQGSSTVTFNGVPATVSSWSDQLIQALVPSGATTGNLLVTVDGFATNAGTFTVVPIPTITNLSPTSGVINSSVTITGTNFGSTQGTSTVSFNGTAATATSWSSTSITATVPIGATNGNVIVAVLGVSGTGVNFTVNSLSISSLSPTSGTVAKEVVINGTGFGDTQGTSTVTFNGLTASPLSWSATQIFTRAPVQATTGNVIVTVAGIASNAEIFTVIPSPILNSLLPTSGGPGTSVTISGSNFGSTQNGSTITLAGGNVNPTSWSATSIAFTVPSGSSGTVNVWVSDFSGDQSNSLSFTIIPAVSIASLSPSSGAVGDPITINGVSFGSTQGTSAVKFNGVTATASSWSDTAILAGVPTGAMTGSVVVTVGSTSSSGVQFTVAARPTISSLSPSSGPAGISVTIAGTNFGSSQVSATVSFNGTPATPSSWGTSSIVAYVPSGATSGNVVVTASGEASSGMTFTVNPGPGVTSLSPTAGGIGATVTITGAGFGSSQGTSTLKFNGTAATATNWSDGLIIAAVPSGATTGNVILTASGIASNALSFTVSSGLSVTAISPNSGNTGNIVTITGTGFGTTQGGSFVRFNGATATINSWSNTSIVTSVPATATSGALVVTVAGASSDGIYFTSQPQIDGISPNPAALPATVTITGQNFGSTQGSSAVTCSGSSSFVSSWSQSSIALQGCVSAVGAIPIQITVNGVASLPAVVQGIPMATISIVVPNTAPVGAAVLIRGTNFGAAQGQSSVMINGVAAQTLSWSSAGIVVSVPSVAPGLATITVTVGGVPTNLLDGLQVGTLPVPTLLQITPAGVNMLIGDTHQFDVVDNTGMPRPDATWSVDNTNLGTITIGASPTTGNSVTLTAVAAGTVTLTVTVQGVNAQTQITISSLSVLTPGTVLWSAGLSAGFTPQGIVQAVPTQFGPDLYSIQTSSDGTQNLVQALTFDGQQMWQSTLGKLAGPSMPDGFGGLLSMQACDSTDPINKPFTVLDKDAVTGATLWQGGFVQFSENTPVCLAGIPKIAIRQDGAVVVAMPLQVTNPLLILDGKTGGTLSSSSIPPSTIQDTTGSVNSCDCFTPLGQPIVDSDGSVNVLYEVRNISEFDRGGGPPSIGSVLWLLRIGPDGTTNSTQVSSSDSADLFPGNIMPDGQGGILATWAVVPIDVTAPPLTNPYQAADVLSGPAISYNMPMAPSQVVTNPVSGLPVFFPPVLGENGTAFVSYGTNVTSFSVSSGVLNWNYQAASQSSLAIIAAMAGNGLVAKTTTQGIDTVTRFDSTGALTQDGWSGNSAQFYMADMWFTSTNTLAAVSANSFDWALSLWPKDQCRGTWQAKRKIKLLVYTVAGANVSSQYIQGKINNGGIDIWQFSAGILFDWDGSIQPPLLGCDPKNPPPGQTCVPGGAFDITNPTLISQLNEILRRLWPPQIAVKLLFVGNQLGPGGETDGYTPPEFTTTDGVKTLSIFENNSSVSVLVAHELGHVLGLVHVNNPINLMCGDTDSWLDSVPCWSTITTGLNRSQIIQAQKTAALLFDDSDDL